MNVNKTSGTEAGRVWKIKYKHEEHNSELTIHYYNKPVKSKKSKFLVQGGSHAAKYLFVFNEMPKIYKMVCEIKPSTPMKLKNDFQCNQCKLKSKTKKDMRVHIATCHSKSNRLGHSPNVKRLGRALTRRKVREKTISYVDKSINEDEKLLDEDVSISVVNDKSVVFDEKNMVQNTASAGQ